MVKVRERTPGVAEKLPETEQPLAVGELIGRVDVPRLGCLGSGG